AAWPLYRTIDDRKLSRKGVGDWHYFHRPLAQSAADEWNHGDHREHRERNGNVGCTHRRLSSRQNLVARRRPQTPPLTRPLPDSLPACRPHTSPPPPIPHQIASHEMKLAIVSSVHFDFPP